MQATRLLKVFGALAILAASLAACSSATTTSGPAAADPSAPGAVAINAGGRAMDGFWADQFFTGGATYGNSETIDMSQIASNPPPAEIFGTERYGAMTYTIPNRSGAQTVTLYFAETYVSGPGKRIFGVTINGATVLSDFDIYASAGGANRAIARTFATTADSNGRVVIEFISGTENPKINGITVGGAGTTPTPQPATPTPTPAAPPTNSSDAKASAGCGKTRALQDGTVTVESNGSRSYILRAPDNYDANHPYRLVLAYHWAGGTAQQVAGGTGATESPFYGLWDLANNSTIFVAPVGLGSGQNTGWPNANGGDVAFTDAILAQLEAGLCIDTSRIFANGFSYGAGMSYALACARPDVFRGVALYSGALLSGCEGGTKPIAFYASTSRRSTASRRKIHPSPRSAAVSTSAQRTRAAPRSTRSNGVPSTATTTLTRTMAVKPPAGTPRRCGPSSVSSDARAPELPGGLLAARMSSRHADGRREGRRRDDMPTYAAGATVERRYPGPDAETARKAAEPQIGAFVGAGFSIGSERWEEDLASGGAPIGDAISSGAISQIAGHGGNLVITYVANAPTDLPQDVPAYTLKDPRRANMEAWSQLQVVVGAIFIVVFLAVFLMIVGQMSSGPHLGMP
jgi:poly(3-hydroxybutyrate) depolymerase